MRQQYSKTQSKIQIDQGVDIQRIQFLIFCFQLIYRSYTKLAFPVIVRLLESSIT